MTVGAKWAADRGSATADAAFADEPGSDFEVVSAAEKRSSLLAGLCLGGKAGPIDVRVGYQGLLDSNATSHSANFRLILLLGGE